MKPHGIFTYNKKQLKMKKNFKRIIVRRNKDELTPQIRTVHNGQQVGRSDKVKSVRKNKSDGGLTMGKKGVLLIKADGKIKYKQVQSTIYKVPLKFENFSLPKDFKKSF